MRILLTGASSFTGAWFARELTAAGHQVTATFRRRPEAYPDALRQRRVAWAAEGCRPVYGPSFGDPSFLELAQEPFDLLAHHAADVTSYKSPDFDAVAAVASNTRALPAVLQALSERGCRRVVLTGSVFENGEGAGSDGLPDFSPYGLSKALTAQVFRYHCRRAGMALGKFVIPNPFGPWEEPRYTSYLMRTWLGGGTARCASPLYVRDNIHVSLLARAYARFTGDLAATAGFAKLCPSGYAESQGAFTQRLAEAMRPRLGRPCAVELQQQVEFPEPRVRTGTDVLDARGLGFDETAAWDEMARFYQTARPG